MRTVIITGSSGLVGSEAVLFFERRGWRVTGVDCNLRRDFFGADGDTTPTLQRLLGSTRQFEHHDIDIRNRAAIDTLVASKKPQLIFHCAAQPSHDLAKDRPFDDFETNAVGTLNVLEAARRHCPESPFVFMSTNKVYGDAPNEYPFVELETRYDFADPACRGIDETCRIDACLHSLFGVSKASADLMVQEYGRYFSMPTVCFRGGCLTGSQHRGAELHGFLAYLAKAVAEGRRYRIYGYKGKQVRDNLHAYDVCEAALAFFESPTSSAVYNLGGGRETSVSMLEAIGRFEELLGRKLDVEYVPQARVGDHQCYITDLTRFRTAYPRWDVTRKRDDVFKELAEAARKSTP